MKIAEQRGRHAGDALAAAAVDLLARERGQHAIAVAVLAGGAAERAGEARARRRARDRDRRIGGAAAVDDGNRLACTLPSGGGKRSTRKTSSSTVMPAHRTSLPRRLRYRKTHLLLHPGADDVIGDRDRRRRGQALGMLPQQHRRHLLAVEPARVLELVAVDHDVARHRLARGSRSSARSETARAASGNSSRSPQTMPASSSVSRRTASSMLSPGSTKPARQDHMLAAKRSERPSRQRSPSTASMITTGSVRGKCCDLAGGQSRRQPACDDVGRRAAIRAEAMARVPVEQRLALRPAAADARRRPGPARRSSADR